jgi:hypothetical protein
MLGRRMVPLALLVAIALAGCGSSSTAGPTAPAASRAPGASAAPVETPSASEAPPTAAPTSAPAGTVAPADSSAPSDTSSPSAEPSAPAAGGAGSTACSGSDRNRDFFAAAAQTFTWDVYCAVLPDGWFVDTGSYLELADGGTVVVTYRGPGDARIELREGAYCTAGGSACSPRDHDLGTASFGDLPGELVTLGPNESDGFAIYVDPGAAPSWAITGTGMDQTAFTAIAAALHRVRA